MRNFVNRINKKIVKRISIVPAWIVLLFDLCIVYGSSILALLLRDNFKIPAHFSSMVYLVIPLIFVAVRFVYFLILKVPILMVRYTNTKDAITLFISCFLGSITLIIANIISFQIEHLFLIPLSVVIMEFFITLIFLLIYRLAFKTYYLEVLNPTKFKKDIAIMGAGVAGITTKRALDRDSKSQYNVIAFLDEDPKKIGKIIESVPVINASKLSSYLSKSNVSFLIIAIQKILPDKVNDITEIALQYNVKVMIVPPVAKWINGELSFKQIKKVKIEDLLERDPIVVDESLVNRDVENQTIMISGAAGSIGSEIVRQIIKRPYKQLILVDNAETPMFYIQNECRNINELRDIYTEIADVCDHVSMDMLMQRYRPDTVYHAAAYKHVPLMEENVCEAVKVNVAGTRIFADLSVQYGVKKFVMISTDKAVNPTNVMGASKRIAEIYIQSLNFQQNATKFITTRFGNVLGSNGSVIPTFRQQIECGGPVTVTHKEITRYFMTISEACQLVLIASTMGNGGEIFIFDMGHSVRIYDLAVKMIKLSGLLLGKDINIEITGLRPGEKLYEELLASQENTIKTGFQKIMIAKVRTYPYEEVAKSVSELVALRNADSFTIVRKMKEIVPEYISRNSEFEKLD
jgi:FlaA1/EpsC-like NDP-sugar epimerase